MRAESAKVDAVTLSRFLPSVKASYIFMFLLIATLGFYIVYPLVLILLNSFNVAAIGAPPTYGLQAWKEAFDNPGIWVSLWNTIKVAVASNALIFPVGALIAWILARTNIPFAHGFEFLFWIAFMLPSLAVTFGWMLLLDPYTGLINMGLKKIPFLTGAALDIYSFWGIVWVHFVSGIDAVVILLTPTLRRMDASFEEASEVAGASTVGTMLRITLPMMTPALVVVFLLRLIRSLESFETELLLGIPWGFYVYSTKIVDLARQEPPLLNQAAALASMILVFLAVVVPTQQSLIRRREFTTVTGRFKPKLIALGRWKYPALTAMCLVIALAVAFPVLSVLGGSFMVRFGFFDMAQTWTLAHWRGALTDARFILALKNTLIVAGGAALVGVILFSLVAYVLVRTKLPGRSILDAMCWIPSAIPGVLAGLGLLWFFLGTPIFQQLYGTLVVIMIASIMGGVTIATQIIKANFIQLGKELEEASWMCGAGFWRTYFKVVFPLMAQTLILIAVLKFVFAARNTASIILLATSETRTLGLLALDQIASGYPEVASTTILLVVLLSTGVALVARFFGLQLGIRD
ncbi:MAG: iron ABC transporter permease [Deltaproteobacteria bacterium]|nr:iron ABC transporter permease [Deltaproteobacteria bacterium]